MGDCTREKALSIAIKYLGEQYLGQLEVTDVLPDEPFYKSSSDFDNCWVIYVSSPGMIGASRYVLISKKTGKIFFDGMVGE
jgi:hypothetical protein